MKKPLSYPDLLLAQFLSFYNKQDVLDKLESRYLIQGYGHSETNCVNMIGKLEQPNVTKIAKELHLTRGAVSKIVKKLIASEDVEPYQNPGNQKEIYYKLTAKGRLLYEEHHRRHAMWEDRERRFFEKMEKSELKVIIKFMSSFNKYLDEKIKELKKREGASN